MMNQLNKREVVKRILELKETDYIPVILNTISLSAARYGYSMQEIISSSEKFTECIIGTRKALGYDGLCGGLNLGITSDMAGHLENKDGIVSMSGQETISKLEDLGKLKPYNPDKSTALQNILKNIKTMRQEQPNEPVFVITSNPASTVLKFMDAKDAFRCMAKEPEVFIKMAEALEDVIFSAVKKLIEADVDFLWSPMPNFSGFCISKKTYEKCVWESNKRFNKRVREAGGKLVIHTCGKYDDRLDLVAEEYGNGWHIADTVTERVVEQYGGSVAIMGNIPSVSIFLEGSPEEVYKVAYNDCIVGGKNGGFILSGDCDLSPLTPEENIKQVIKAARDAEKELYSK